MIHFEEALKIVLDQPVITKSEKIPLLQAAGRILAEDCLSDTDLPPFNKSAVDGYACKFSDFQPGSEITLECIETISAGTIPRNVIQSGYCSRIMTGAMIPEGADGVVMVEDTENKDNRITVLKKPVSANICYRGEDILAGDLVLKRGTLIRPAEVAVLAGIGITEPWVYQLPSVAIISTGDELCEPWEKPGPGMIRNSNASQLEVQVRLIPAQPAYHGIARDDPGALHTFIREAIENYDLTLLSGGVSMGDFDFVPSVMKDCGVELLFEKIAIQPGKPTVFGKKGNRHIFGLPGNPVSSFVLFELLVKPFLMKMMGNETISGNILLPAGIDFTRKKSDRMAVVPVKVTNGQVFPVEYHGSAHIHAYSSADALMILQIGSMGVKCGELVNVRLL